jgi:ATP-dependent DNA helicase PIF1
MMRLGKVSSLGWSIFRAIEREVQYDDDIKPTELWVSIMRDERLTKSFDRFPLRCHVEEANNTRLAALHGEEQTYYAKDVAYYDMYGFPLTRERASKLLDNTLAPSELRLRVGAQVMLIKVSPSYRTK